MIQFIFVLYLFCISGFFSKLYANVNFIKGSLFLPLALSIFLSVSGGLGILHIAILGSYFVIALISILILIKLFRSKSEIRSLFNDIYFWVFVGLSIVIYIVCKNNTPIDSDELSIWGLLPRIIYLGASSSFDNAFALNNISNTHSPIAYYLAFATNIRNAYSTSTAYIAYYILSLAAYLSLLSSISWKRNYMDLVKFILVLFVPLAFFYPNGGTAFRILMNIDYRFIKAILFSLSLNITITSQCQKSDISLLSLLLLVIGTMDILGFWLVFFVIIHFFVVLSHKEQARIEQLKKYGVLILVLFITALWNISSFQLNSLDLIAYFNALYLLLFETLKISNMIPLGFYLFILLPIIVYCSIEDKKQNMYMKLFILQVMGFFLYFCFVVELILRDDANHLISQLRDYSVYIMGISLCWIPFLLANRNKGIQKQLRDSMIFIIVSFTIIGSQFDVLRDKFFNWSYYSNTIYNISYGEHRYGTEYHIEKISTSFNQDTPIKLFFSMGGCDFSMSYMHELIRFELLEHQIYVTHNPLTLDCMTVEKAAEFLSEVEYLYLAYPISDQFNKELNELYNNDVFIEAEKVYQIVRKGDSVEFVALID